MPDRQHTRRVLAAQNISRNCLVCGTDNPFGLHGRFYELARDESGDEPDGLPTSPAGGRELLGVFAPRDEHQSYPGRLHGGVAAAVLDETIGRAILLLHDDEWGVTAELAVRYRKPLPLDEEIRCVARITRDTRRLFEGTGEIVLADGTVAAEARGKYVKMPIGTIAEGFDGSEWFPDVRERPRLLDL